MRKKIIGISFIFITGIALLLAGGVTQAQVIPGLDPESGAATCPSGFGLENFESGTDGFYGGGPPIASTVPGVQFTTTQGQDWLTGDWTVGGYNGKYPSGAYTSGGNKWAWLGVSQGSGIIDFTQGNASYVSIYTSTFSGVVVDAYANDGTFLESSGWAGNNLSTGQMTQLLISRPTADVGYVIVHDTGNYWLMDWLCTNAPGVPTPTPVDTTPPVLNLPPSVTLEATGPGGVVHTFVATATDDQDPSPTVYCTPPSGSLFPLGYTSVNCTATDASGNSSSGSFAVTVVDTTPPALTVPAYLTVECNASGGISSSDPQVQNWLNSASATDIVDPTPIIANNSPSFCSLGMTTVTFTATDASGNSSSGTADITVVDTTSPMVTAALVSVCENDNDNDSDNDCDDDDELFQVVFSCTDICSTSLTTTANINGVMVTNGQIVELDLDDDEQEVEWDNGVLQIEAPSFLLTVSCTDASGNVGTATAFPIFINED